MRETASASTNSAQAVRRVTSTLCVTKYEFDVAASVMRRAEVRRLRRPLLVWLVVTTRSVRPFPPSASHDTRRVSEGSLLPPAEGAFAEVVAQCTRSDVDERPSFAQLLALLEAPQIAERVSLTDDSPQMA